MQIPTGSQRESQGSRIRAVHENDSEAVAEGVGFEAGAAQLGFDG